MVETKSQGTQFIGGYFCKILNCYNLKHIIIVILVVSPRAWETAVRAEGDVGQVGSRQKHGTQWKAQAWGGDCR